MMRIDCLINMNGFHQLSLSLHFKEYDNEREHVEKKIAARVSEEGFVKRQ